MYISTILSVGEALDDYQSASTLASLGPDAKEEN